ncbi:MAG: YceI family protein [Fluviibacter sp.]
MKLNRLLPILISGLLYAATANAVQYDRVDTVRSSIRFVPVLMGTKTEGSFKKFTAQIRFDPEKPAQAQAKAEIDLQSFDIGFDEATEEALGPNWFDVKRTPKATFVSTQVKALGSDKFELSGNLTIRDQTKPVRFPVTLTRDANGAARLDGSLVIKRLDFGLGQGQWAGTGTVANDVTVQLKLFLSSQ